MKAIVLNAVNDVLVTDVPEPQVYPGQVKVRVCASGLCATDSDIISGHLAIPEMPRILGHQGAGEIVALGADVEDFQVGQRIVVSIDKPCGDCSYCRQGRPNICRDLKRFGFELDGSHAEYMVVPRENLVLLPDSIPYEEGCILADAVASMYHALVVRAG